MSSLPRQDGLEKGLQIGAPLNSSLLTFIRVTWVKASAPEALPDTPENITGMPCPSHAGKRHGFLCGFFLAGDVSWLEEWYQVRHGAETDVTKSQRCSGNCPKVLHHREGGDLGSQLQRGKQ